MLGYLHSKSSQFYACMRPHRECMENVHIACLKLPVVLVLRTSDSDQFQESQNWHHRMAKTWHCSECSCNRTRYQLPASRLFAKYRDKQQKKKEKKSHVHKGGVPRGQWFHASFYGIKTCCPHLSGKNIKCFTLLLWVAELFGLSIVFTWAQCCWLASYGLFRQLFFLTLFGPRRRKKRVTTGEADTWGKELGKCTHQWTTNDEKNTNERFRQLVSSSGKRRKTATERSREEDRREWGNQTG